MWETEPSFFEESAVLADFAAAWQDSDKLVYSATLTDPVTKRTRIVPAFEADEVRALKEASSAELLIGGPGLAAHALRAGVVDEVLLMLASRPSPWLVAPVHLLRQGHGRDEGRRPATHRHPQRPSLRPERLAPDDRPGRGPLVRGRADGHQAGVS